MPSRIDDRWVWLGFGVFLTAAAWRIRRNMTDVVALILIDPVQYAPSRDGQQTSEAVRQAKPEDSISIETLRTLATSPNRNIANAATSLIVSRFLQSPEPDPAETISRDLSSSNMATRRKAETAVRFLQEWGSDFLHISLPDTDAGTQDYSTLAGQLRSSSPWYRLDDDLDLGGAVDASVSNPGGSVVPTVSMPVAGWTNIPRERPTRAVEYDATEMERRRRRREAMVLHEGEGGLGEENIIRPTDHSSPLL